MTAEKIELISTLIKAAMMIVTIFVAPALRSWLKAHASEKAVKTMQQWADIAVKAAEQLKDAMDLQDPDGEKRKAWARLLIEQAAKKANIKMTDNEINMLIEAAVMDNNDWWHEKVKILKAEEG